MSRDGREGRRLAAGLRRRGLLDGLRPPWKVGAAVRIGEHVSRRRFYRLFPEGGGAGPEDPGTLVLVAYPDDDATTLERHVQTTRWLEAAGVPVPAIHGIGVRGLLVEDGGDRLLASSWRRDRARRAYEAAVEVVRRLQRHGRRAPPPDPGRALDRARLLDELAFFERHTVRGWLRTPGGGATRRRGYAALSEAVAALPARMCHRDFHARNLLVRDDDGLLVLDFQDLMPGPFCYDLASLVWDNYCDVPEEIRTAALERFWDGCDVEADRLTRLQDGGPAPEIPAGLPGPARRAFCLVAAQRHLKALGTFGYQVTRGGRPGFGRFAPRTWRHARRALEALGMDALLAELTVLDGLEDPGRPGR